jgi:hypothetical protein
MYDEFAPDEFMLDGETDEDTDAMDDEETEDEEVEGEDEEDM